ncbi:hypothetical protein [Schlesneria sp. T3-172]|uniref:hypothetical protein n=1 Tax=Schlesneria sphaerica TaxID=3373610 RepID=UPI0037C91312
MPALRIDLDDQATDGLDVINAKLEEMAIASQNAADGADILTEAQERQVVVINEQKDGLSELGQTGLRVFGDLSVAAIKGYTDIKVASQQAFTSIVNGTISAAASVAKYAIVTSGALKGIKTLWGQNTEAVQVHEEIVGKAYEAEHNALGGIANDLLFVGSSATAAGLGLGTVGKAAEVAGKAAIGLGTGLGPVLVGAGLGLKGFEVALDSTGRKFKEFAEDTSKQTKSQAEAFDKFTAKANELGVTLDDLVQSEGITDVNAHLEKTFGVKTIEVYESNLTRFNEALRSLQSELVRPIGDVGGGIVGALSAVNEAWSPIPDILKEFDASMTRTTNISVENMGLLKSLAQQTSDSISDVLAILTGDTKTLTDVIRLNMDQYLKWDGVFNADAKYRSAAEAAREFAAEQKRVSDAQAASVDDFARIRVMNAEITKSDAARAEAARIASITTVEGIQAELRAWNERRSKLANDNQLDDSTAKKMLAERETLVTKLANLEAGLREKARAQEAEFAAQVKARRLEETDWVNTQVAKSKELYELEMKRVQARSGFQKDLNSTARDQDSQSGMEGARARFEAERDAAISRMRATGATEIQVKSQVAEMEQKFAAAAHNVKLQQIADEFNARRAELEKEELELERSGITGIEKERRLAKIRLDLDKAQFEARKKGIEESGRAEREQASLISRQRLAEQEALFAAEQERRDKAKADRDEALKKAFPTQDVLNSTDPRKVLEQLRADRALKEQQAQAERDSALGQQAMAGDKAAIAKWNKNQQAAINRGRNSANRDFENGNVGEAELQQAQGEVAQQNLAALQAQGRITQEVAIGLAETLNAVTSEAAKNAALQQTVERLVVAAKGISQSAKRANDSYRSQMGSLN